MRVLEYSVGREVSREGLAKLVHRRHDRRDAVHNPGPVFFVEVLAELLCNLVLTKDRVTGKRTQTEHKMMCMRRTSRPRGN
jgi:hypothetical protein